MSQTTTIEHPAAYITFPPHLIQAPTSRRSYQREPSPGAGKSRSPAPRRFSHSHSRPPAFSGRRSSVSSERSGARGDSVSDAGSRAPLWRNPDGVAGGGMKVEKGEDRWERYPVVSHFLGHRSIPPAFPSLFLWVPQEVEVILLTFIASFVSILLVSAVSFGLAKHFADVPLVVGSFGASAVLLYAAPEGPLSQPRNLVGGHVFSTIVGICVRLLFELSPRFGEEQVASPGSFIALTPVACALAVSLSILVMQLTKTLHPPGGATALLCIFQRSSGWTFLLIIFLCVLCMGIWTCIIKNLGRRRYPAYWWLPPQVPAEVSTAVVDPSHLEKQFHHSEQRLGVVEEGEDDPEMIVRGRVIERGRGR